MDDHMDDRIAINRRNWDARTPVHAASEFYDLPGLIAGADRLAGFEWAELGELAGREVAHRQCHLGTDTICLARAGATVTGLDLSGESVRRARELAAAVDLPVEYVEGNVLDPVEDVRAALGGREFDLVHTGKGALVWLPDLDHWARVVAALLRPGGRLYLAEFHPLVTALGSDPDVADLRVRRDLIGGGTLGEWTATHTYTDGPDLDGETRCFQWEHDTAEVITAIAGAGLRIESVREHTTLPWDAWRGLVPAGPPGWWRLPEGVPRVPLMYSVTATKER